MSSLYICPSLRSLGCCYLSPGRRILKELLSHSSQCTGSTWWWSLPGLPHLPSTYLPPTPSYPSQIHLTQYHTCARTGPPGTATSLSSWAECSPCPESAPASRHPLVPGDLSSSFMLGGFQWAGITFSGDRGELVSLPALRLGFLTPGSSSVPQPLTPTIPHVGMEMGKKRETLWVEIRTA